MVPCTSVPSYEIYFRLQGSTREDDTKFDLKEEKLDERIYL